MKRIVFVDDEPCVLQGLQRMLRTQRQEWEMVFVQSGAEALQLLDQQPADVVVTDMRMPGMDGAQLLTEVRWRFPQTVRIVLSGHTDKEMILRSVGPAHQFLAKPCDPDALKDTIARACALRKLLHSEHLKGLVSQVRSLPSLPHLYLQIVEELRSPDVSLQRIGRIIAQDIGMTARVLQLVNSAFFGIQRRITQPVQAVSLLGLETVNALVLSVKLFSSFDQTKMNAQLTNLWEHSLTTAQLAKRIAQSQPDGAQQANYAFMGGLLHDAGKLVLATDLAAAYRQALALAQSERLADWVAERRVLGATHGEVGAYLLGLWGLPDPIVEAVAFHHEPGDCAGRAFSALTAVHVANALEREARSAPGAPNPCAVSEDYLAALGLQNRLAAWRELAEPAAEETKPDMTDKLLCVDDDPSVLAGYHRQLRKKFNLQTAASAEAALVMLQTQGPYAVIVSDMRMPGLDGVQFLARAKTLAPDSVRIMLTGYAEQRTAIKAINEGSIFRFLTKPCETATLCQAIASGIAQYRLVTAEKELLGQTLRGSIRLLIDVLALVNPAAFGRMSRIRQVVRQLAQGLGGEHSWECDVAAMLSQIGCVTVPAEVLETLWRGGTLTPDEAHLVALHPTVGHDLVARIPRLEAVAEIIALQDRPFAGNGSAVGTGPHGPEIPLGARLLKVALDHDVLKSTGMTSVEAVRRMQHRPDDYDPQVLAAMLKVAEAEEAEEIREVTADELMDHMVLADDVLSRTGMLILSRGQEVTAPLRERLRNYARRAAIREPIRVFARTD